MDLEDYGFIKIWVPAPGRPGARPDNGIQPLPGAFCAAEGRHWYLQEVGEINEIVTKKSYFIYKTGRIWYYSGNERMFMSDSLNLQAFAFLI